MKFKLRSILVSAILSIIMVNSVFAQQYYLPSKVVIEDYSYSGNTKNIERKRTYQFKYNNKKHLTQKTLTTQQGNYKNTDKENYTYTYRSNGIRKTGVVKSTNSVDSKLTFDGKGRLTKKTKLSDYTFKWYSNGTLKTITDSNNQKLKVNYWYYNKKLLKRIIFSGELSGYNIVDCYRGENNSATYIRYNSKGLPIEDVYPFCIQANMKFKYSYYSNGLVKKINTYYADGRLYESTSVTYSKKTTDAITYGLFLSGYTNCEFNSKL